MVTRLSDAELQSILDFTIGLARRAGEVMLEGSEKIRESGATDEKKNSVDLVTEYDVKVEQLVIGELKVAYPSYHLYVPSLYLACLRSIWRAKILTPIPSASARRPSRRGDTSVQR